LYYTAHLEWFQKYLGGGGPPWTTEQFLRNQVFDPKSGKRLVAEPEALGDRPGVMDKKHSDEKAPTTMSGKPDRKP